MSHSIFLRRFGLRNILSPRIHRIIALSSAVVGLCLSMGACSGDSGKTGKAHSGDLGTASRRQGASESRQRLIIATDRGIEEIDSTGRIVQRISPTPARRPRLLADGTLMFMAVRFAELRQVRLDGTGERPIAMISPEVAAQCNIVFPEPWDPATLLYSDADMAVDESGKVVCMHLRDGNEDESDASVWLRVDLPSGPGSRGNVSLVCGAEPPGDDFLCAPAKKSDGSTAATPDASPESRFFVQEGALFRRDGSGPVEVFRPDAATLAQRAYSSSGRYALISASIAQGKYRIQRVLVLDRESGDIRPIVPGPWPKPMSKTMWRALEQGKDVTVQAALHSDVRALAHDDLFIIDTLLVAPGRRIVDTGAQFAQ